MARVEWPFNYSTSSTKLEAEWYGDGGACFIKKELLHCLCVLGVREGTQDWRWRKVQLTRRRFSCFFPGPLATEVSCISCSACACASPLRFPPKQMLAPSTDESRPA